MLAEIGEVTADLIGNQEALVLRPAVVPLGATDFLYAQGLTVRSMTALLSGGAVADDALDDDHGRPFLLSLERVQRAG